MLYSIIVPVYNRPEEIRELLQSLTAQIYKGFEVLIIEDGSEKTCRHIADQFSDVLTIRYFYKSNSGQGFSRNYGFERARGDYFVVFDSDCIIPPDYFLHVDRHLSLFDTDCWGGPDRAHPTFTPVQKAINFSMTSFLTTGGIRGSKERVGAYRPRSFNMGISREVFERTGGYKITRMGEDIEFSIRIEKHGFTSAYIEEAFVYHKRRTSLSGFFRQLHFFGRARVNIMRFHPWELKPFHLFPVVFLLGLLLPVASLLLNHTWLNTLSLAYPVYGLLVFISALFTEKSLPVAILAVAAVFIQLSAYGLGFLYELSKE